MEKSLSITWDESYAGDNRVALLVLAPGFAGPIATPLDHYSLLATIEDRLGVARLGAANRATSLNDQLQAGTAGSDARG